MHTTGVKLFQDQPRKAPKMIGSKAHKSLSPKKPCVVYLWRHLREQ